MNWWGDFYESRYKSAPVYVKSNQMMDFGHVGLFNAEIVFGNPVNLLKVLEMELDLWRIGKPSKACLTGFQAASKVFAYQYKRLKQDLGIVTVRTKCGPCQGSGLVRYQAKTKNHWSGVKLYAFPGRHFINTYWCQYCEGYGYREWLSEKALKTQI